MTMRGLFITVEGIEGVGKSTNIAFLLEQLRSRGVDVLATREPGGTAVGEDVRRVLLEVRDGSMSPVAELLLIFAARAQHIAQVIEPALAAGRWVLCDRFTDATFAYQGGGRGVDTHLIRQVEELVQGPLRPDYTLLLDIDAQAGLGRARERGELDRIERETVAFFERVRQCYLELAEAAAGRYHIVDAGRPLEEVQQQVSQLGAELLDCWRARRATQA